MWPRVKQGCFYCEHNEVQKERMIPIMPLKVSTLFLNRDQTHAGRCIVALNWHVDELFELSEDERNLFMSDVAKVARCLKKTFNAGKINYGIYGDTVSHLHFHLVPKVATDADWDDAFVNNPAQVKELSDYQPVIDKISTAMEALYEEI